MKKSKLHQIVGCLYVNGNKNLASVLASTVQGSPAITEIEKKVLQSLHLRGIMGKMGAMTKKKRADLLNGLIKKGLLDKNGNVTKKGIEVSTLSIN